jgi:hypothetical protein
MLPFGPRLTTVFASRWKALFWAGGVMVTAYFTAVEARHEPDPDQAAVVPSAAQRQGASQASPWAK